MSSEIRLLTVFTWRRKDGGLFDVFASDMPDAIQMFVEVSGYETYSDMRLRVTVEHCQINIDRAAFHRSQGIHL